MIKHKVSRDPSVLNYSIKIARDKGIQLRNQGKEARTLNHPSKELELHRTYFLSKCAQIGAISLVGSASSCKDNQFSCLLPKKEKGKVKLIQEHLSTEPTVCAQQGVRGRRTSVR